PEEFDDVLLPENALRNCLPLIEPDLPSMQKLAELQCASQGLQIETVLCKRWLDPTFLIAR
ncbi:hypothetical protein, partial [Profundibacter sp.]